MKRNKNTQAGQTEKPVSRGRHEQNCGICKHPRREDIEQAFVSWRSPAKIAEEYGLRDRSSVYRHSHALGLFAKRQRNIRAALERIIERTDDVEVNASAVVAAVVAYSKINAAGLYIERTEKLNLNELFDRMSKAELEDYAKDGTLPLWFTQTVGQPATLEHSHEGKNAI